MASSFEIFEDRENLKEKTLLNYGESKRDRVMLGSLTNKAIGNENPTDQVRKQNLPLSLKILKLLCALFPHFL